MKSELLNYSATLHSNREVFLINYHQEFQAFEDNDKQLQKIKEVISKKRSDQRESLVGLLPFLLIIERQARNTFECLSRYQSYDAWIVFRPALEAVLIIGKFLDNPANAELWKNRRQIWENKKKDKKRHKRYKKEFEGNGLIPKSLPHGKEFRQLLGRINDEFMHTNYNYFTRSSIIKKIDSKNVFWGLVFTDNDFQEHKAYVFSLLHMYRIMTSSLGQALASKYSKEETLNIEIQSIERIWKPKVVELVREKPDLKKLCQTFGLWKI